MDTRKISCFKRILVVYFSLYGKKTFKDGSVKCLYPIMFVLGMLNWLFILGGFIAVAYFFDIIFNFKTGYISSILAFITWIITNILFVCFTPCKYED